ncbi:MAG TPA: hypothetical protein VGG02_05975 [Chthoniobacterales bacterium]
MKPLYFRTFYLPTLLLSTFCFPFSAFSFSFPGFDSIITPQMFGAIADGAHHPIKQADLDAHKGKWVGNYAIGDERDYIGLQEAIYASFDNGTLKPNASNARLNKVLYLPPGSYLVNKAPTLTESHGGAIYGAGRFVTTITSTFAGPAFQTNGCWYTQFTGICFAGHVAHDGGVFELDGNYDGTNKQGVQGNTFKDCFFDGGGVVSKAFALVRRGGNKAQGSENLFLDCHFQSAKFAGVYISGYNALQNTFIGGNIQGCINGIYVEAGSINVDSMGFQNGFQKQIEGGGFDIVLRNSADDHSSIKNCRTESACFIAAGNNHFVVIDNNNIVNRPPNGQWLPSHHYPKGSLIAGQTKGNGNGHLYLSTTEGTSGTAEPASPVAPYGAALSVKHFLAMVGKPITDGSVTWVPYEYDEAVTSATVAVTNNTFKWGRDRFAGGEIANNSFARADNLESLQRLPVGTTWLMNNHVTRNGGWNTGALGK